MTVLMLLMISNISEQWLMSTCETGHSKTSVINKKALQQLHFMPNLWQLMWIDAHRFFLVLSVFCFFFFLLLIRTETSVNKDVNMSSRIACQQEHRPVWNCANIPTITIVWKDRIWADKMCYCRFYQINLLILGPEAFVPIEDLFCVNVSKQRKKEDLKSDQLH